MPEPKNNQYSGLELWFETIVHIPYTHALLELSYRSSHILPPRTVRSFGRGRSELHNLIAMSHHSSLMKRLLVELLGRHTSSGTVLLSLIASLLVVRWRESAAVIAASRMLF